MYVDLAIVVILLIIVLFVFKRFNSFVYAVAIIDIFLRLLTFIKNNTVVEVFNLIDKYFPESIPNIINKYTDGILTNIIMWVYVCIFAVFLGYIINHFINKRK